MRVWTLLPIAVTNRKIKQTVQVRVSTNSGSGGKPLSLNHLYQTARRIFASACLLGAITIAAPAAAQQNMQGMGAQSPPPPVSAPMVIPGNQGGGGTTLELPATAPSRQTQPNIPPPEPPTQELVLPMRQLRAQPGYQQVTVTVTEPN